ncbi:hypothetical protein CLV84_0283 [Neolewinella xylanilytica]|uniref:Uncharacterized protein n=1 Tax=Neolewinella xylanilytica TaxID=1514080 RepID=A0A2S6I762_9BACT|nr:hypothetical protein [Neolewinella xylanilytica]PPK87343.1 hypothetical protein CLV84_0283 [Neolewinella xylanilytica]
MLSFFRTNQSFASLLLFGYALLLQLPAFVFDGGGVTADGDIGHYGGWLRSAVGSSRLLSAILPPVLVATAGIVANNLCDRYRISRTVTQFPGLFIVLTWAMVPSFHLFDPQQVNLVFLLLSIGALGSTYKSMTSAVARFNAGFWLGLAALLEPTYLLLIPGFFLGISIFRTADLPSLAQLLGGTLVVYFLAAVYAYLRGDLLEFYVNDLGVLGIWSPETASAYDLVGVGILFALVLVVLMGGASSRVLLSIEGGKNLSFVYWVLLFAIPVAFLGSELHIVDAQLLVAPLGLLLGLWFVDRSDRQAEFLHLLLFAAALTLTVLGLTS